MAAYEPQTLKIESVERGVFLDVWLYTPSTSGPYPLVVAGHGLSVIKAAGLQAFGQRWATDAGYASLIFDYRCFGDSDGQPRNLVSLDKQLQDYRSVINWARQRPDIFMNNKIVAMGSALSGLSVASLIIEDSALAGAMAHSPMLEGYATLSRLPFNPRLMFWVLVDSVKSKLGLAPTFIRCVGRPDEFALLNTPSCYPGFQAMFKQSPIPFSQAPNLVAPRISVEIMNSRPGANLREAHSPMLIVAAIDDDLIPIDIAREVATAAGDKVTLIEVSCGHFDVMAGGKGYEQNIQAQVAFLRRLL